ncbi:MAG TPA: NAD(+)/NADH kinase [Thermomicrobiales bacterium]|nr:NAD(+)/NADH kinase [Thermomicrobiales bacterium]
MSQRLGIVAAFSKPEAKELSTTVRQWLEARGHTTVAEPDILAGDRRNVDAIIVFGGDGLMMRMANAFPDIPLFGINFGKVGFLALVEQKDWTAALQLFLDGKYDIDESSTLQASIYRDDKEYDQGWAINDVVIRGGNRMIEDEVYIDGYYVNTYPGDGMIVSTPRGSTAYCMAAGGPILTPGVRGFAVVPINCHSPIRTPMITSEEALIEIIHSNVHPGYMILDGQQTMEVQKGDLIKIQRGEHTFQLIRVTITNFFDAIRTKFNFQVRPDAVPSRLAIAPARDEADKVVSR